MPVKALPGRLITPKRLIGQVLTGIHAFLHSSAPSFLCLIESGHQGKFRHEVLWTLHNVDGTHAPSGLTTAISPSRVQFLYR